MNFFLNCGSWVRDKNASGQYPGPCKPPSILSCPGGIAGTDIIIRQSGTRTVPLRSIYLHAVIAYIKIRQIAAAGCVCPRIPAACKNFSGSNQSILEKLYSVFLLKIILLHFSFSMEIILPESSFTEMESSSIVPSTDPPATRSTTSSF